MSNRPQDPNLVRLATAATRLEPLLDQIAFVGGSITGLLLDLMPTESAVLGFTNRWYSAALQHARKFEIGKYEIRVITAPYFLGTKLEAFRGRGRYDFNSYDLEDIVSVVDGRPELVDEVSSAPADLRKYLSDQFAIQPKLLGRAARPSAS